MKKLALSLALSFISFSAWSQNDYLDAYARKMIELEQSIQDDKQERLRQVTVDLSTAIKYHEQSLDNVRYSLFKHHRQYSTGTSLMVGGVFLQGISFMFSDDLFDQNIRLPIIAVGSAAILAGAIIHIDSHRHIGIAANGIKLSIDLK